jgi:hypothetical protein
MRAPRREKTVLDMRDVYVRSVLVIAVGLSRLLMILAVLGVLTGPYKLGCVVTFGVCLLIAKLGMLRLNRPLRSFRVPA